MDEEVCAEAGTQVCRRAVDVMFKGSERSSFGSLLLSYSCYAYRSVDT